MSYSRFGHSAWYIYWLSNAATTAQGQELAVRQFGKPERRFKLAEVRKFVKHGFPEAGADEAWVIQCMKEFVKDVESEYGKPGSRTRR